MKKTSLRCGVLIASSFAAGCNDTGTPTTADGTLPLAYSSPSVVVPTDAPTFADNSGPPLPAHNYDERRGDTYYYIAAVSEEDRKRGRAVGSVSAFQYLGQNADGEHIVASLNTNGSVAYRAKCARNCRIIDTDYGEKIAFSPSSIIGAALDDAFHGRLRIAEWSVDRETPDARSDAASDAAEGVPQQPQTLSLPPQGTDASPAHLPVETAAPQSSAPAGEVLGTP